MVRVDVAIGIRCFAAHGKPEQDVRQWPLNTTGATTTASRVYSSLSFHQLLNRYSGLSCLLKG